ncbi:MAG: hypothetical protein ACI4I9_06885 [Porcipelethomonas sp.]
MKSRGNNIKNDILLIILSEYRFLLVVISLKEQKFQYAEFSKKPLVILNFDKICAIMNNNLVILLILLIIQMTQKRGETIGFIRSNTGKPVFNSCIKKQRFIRQVTFCLAGCIQAAFENLKG